MSAHYPSLKEKRRHGVVSLQEFLSASCCRSVVNDVATYVNQVKKGRHFSLFLLFTWLKLGISCGV